MSSGIGEIYDDYRDYRRLCEELGENPVAGLPLASMDLWEAHWNRLKRQSCRPQSHKGAK
jgi:hypothetical protein